MLTVGEMLSLEKPVATTQTLLRKIRRSAVGVNGIEITDAQLKDAEQLVDCVTNLVLAQIEQNDENNPLTEIRYKLYAVLEETEERYDNKSPLCLVGATTPRNLIKKFDVVASSTSPWRTLFRLNNIPFTTIVRDPQNKDIIVAPLSSGAILTRLAHKISHSEAKMALGFVGAYRFKAPSDASLPPTTSWPEQKALNSKTVMEADNIFILDDEQASGATAYALGKMIQDQFGIAPEKILCYDEDLYKDVKKPLEL